MDPALGGPYEFGSGLSGVRQRSADQPSLPERGGRLVLFGALRARFHGAVPLVVRMRFLPGGDRLRLRG
jgi:hypothetical protein